MIIKNLDYYINIRSLLKKEKRMTFFKSKVLSAVLSVMVLYIASCGTILHPERKGQKSGEIDTKIAIYDAIGLIFFLIPGIVAFAVDFSNGTIYLPPGEEKSSSMVPIYDLDKMIAIKTGKKNLTEDDIESVIKEYTGKTVDISSPNVVFKRIEGEKNIKKLSVAMRSKNRH